MWIFIKQYFIVRYLLRAESIFILNIILGGLLHFLIVMGTIFTETETYA
jgi:hypothetical protein